MTYRYVIRPPAAAVRRVTPANPDSIEKLLTRLALVAKSPIYSGGKQVAYCPDHIYLSPTLLREFKCVSGCVACCQAFTLDFTPQEWRRFRWTEEVRKQARACFTPRLVEVCGENFKVVSYDQSKLSACPFLRPTRETQSGTPALGCGFWTSSNSTQPLECAAAPQLRMEARAAPAPDLFGVAGRRVSVIAKKPFGRGWLFDAQCDFSPVEREALKQRVGLGLTILDDTVALLNRYQLWANHFKIETRIPALLAALKIFPAWVAQQPTPGLFRVAL